MSITTSSTLTQRVYKQLRAAILNGELAPDQRLRFAQLSAQYGASIGVLREALVKLSADGIVVNQAQQGYRVMSLSVVDLSDLTETRCLIEALVLRDSIEHGSLSWESDLVAAHHKLTKTPKRVEGNPAPVSPEWTSAHHEFHMALLAGSDRLRLMQIAATLRGAAEIYRRWSMPFEVTKRNVDGEHQQLLQLALDRDADGAAAALTEHLCQTKLLIEDGVEKLNMKAPTGTE